MSAQEPPALLPSEGKHKPDIPPKPPAQSISPPPPSGRVYRRSLSGGKVKNIVSKFSKSSQTREQPSDGAAEFAADKRPPSTKPKPNRSSLQLQIGNNQAPPLPKKRSRFLRKQKESLTGEEAESMEGGRSAPDGKEVEDQLIGGGEEEAEHTPDTPRSPGCDPGCCCVCHLQRPGMKLVWVPMDWEEGGEEKAESEGEEPEGEGEMERGGEGDSEAEVEEPSSVDAEVINRDKLKFNQSLNVLIAEAQRRRSDPGPPTVISSLIASQSNLVPPKTALMPPVAHLPSQIFDENIYEVTLPLPDASPKTIPPPSKDHSHVPQIIIPKPPRRSKLSYSTSKPTSESQEIPDVPDDAPPALLPRVPMAPVHRGGVPLPQPTLEEWRSLLPGSGLSPQRAVSAPPSSPLTPHRAPPPPPKTDPRRLSSASLQSIEERKEEENGGDEEEKDETETSRARSNSFKKEISFIFESHLKDEPLYQTYRDTVITKEIRRQTVCRNISKTSADYAMDWTGLRNGKAAANGSPPLPAACQSTLWQELPPVRESGELEKLSAEQCKYQESMFEVLTSESSYLRSLRVLTELFQNSRELEETLVIRDRKTLFSNILRVREVSERFLKDLEERIFKEIVFPDICDIIHYHAQHNFPAYIDYVRNQIYQEQTYTKLIKNNVQFAAVITRLQESPECHRLPFVSFLLLPFQRITRIKMLIENILKRTKEGTNEEQTASKALASVSKIIDECNTQVGKMKQMEELIHLSQTFEFDKLKALPIISQTRYLEKKGELQEMSRGGTIFTLRAKLTPVHFFLFNDLLIIAAKKSTEKFVVLDYAHRSLVQVQPLPKSDMGVAYEHCFNVILLENHQGRQIDRLFKANSQSDMDRWLAAFPNPSNPNRDEDEVIYEDWDCPQVQCVEQYIAQQADELSLDPTEIINVIRKTNEGWYEGNRLSDGQKGWFPIENVVEITNEHVRRRNLRERYRVIQAAGMVTRNKIRSVQ